MAWNIKGDLTDRTELAVLYTKIVERMAAGGRSLRSFAAALGNLYGWVSVDRAHDCYQAATLRDSDSSNM